MKKMLVEREVWQAKDGSEFGTERKCQIHELEELHRFSDLRFTRNLLDLLKDHKQEIFEIMGWEEGPKDMGALWLSSFGQSGDTSRPNVTSHYEYMLNRKNNMHYSGTLCFSDGITGHSFELINIQDLQLVIQEEGVWSER